MNRKIIVFACLLVSLPVLAIVPYLPFWGSRGYTPTDWELRVVANGGAQPSQNTVNAMENLRVSLIALGLTNKIWSLCIFVPDSLIAATTPLIKNKGSDPWTNNFFGSTNLTINGLQGDGTTKALDTGVQGKNGQAANTSTGSRGLSVVISEGSTNRSQALIGTRNIDVGGETIELLQPSAIGRTEWYPATVATTTVLTNDFNRVGYVSGNVWTNSGTTNSDIFVASPLEAHKLLARTVTSGATGLFPATTSDNTISVFAYKFQGTNTAWSTDRLSMACVNDGFSQTESSNFWWAVYTCRQALGGGTGDPVQEWARLVVNNGGAAVSVNTSNALRTFYNGLDSDGLLYRIAVANAIVPDNLTAARIPVVWQMGAQAWTNFLFDATNLTVNGLVGNGSSKYMQTGVHMATAATRNRGIGANNMGLTTLAFTVPAATVTFDLCDVNSAVRWGLLYNASSVREYDCTRLLLANQDFVSATAPADTTAGYLSGNRLSATSLALFWVTNGVFSIAVTNNGATASADSSTSLSASGMSAWCAFTGTPVLFSDHRVSFMAIHAGLTEPQVSNLWLRVSTLRTGLGGGIP